MSTSRRESPGRGRLIAFEGIDGSGKSSQLHVLAERLRSLGVRVYETSEPTDGPVGSLIRQMMQGRIEGDHRTIAALFVADRLDHLLNSTNGILQRLSEGVTVLTDRFYLSSYAYHSAHTGMDWVVEANSIVARIVRPDLHILLDADPEGCINRMTKDRWHLELYEEVSTLRVVRQRYLEAVERVKSHERVVVLDGCAESEEVARAVWCSVSPLYASEAR